MSKNTRVHHERGFTMKRGSAENGVRKGNLVWNEDGTIRDATPEEIFDSMAMIAAERLRAGEILERSEGLGLRFEKPKTTKYRQPWQEYEEIDAPMAVRVCRWPRQFAMEAA